MFTIIIPYIFIVYRSTSDITIYFVNLNVITRIASIAHVEFNVVARLLTVLIGFQFIFTFYNFIHCEKYHYTNIISLLIRIILLIFITYRIDANASTIALFNDICIKLYHIQAEASIVYKLYVI